MTIQLDMNIEPVSYTHLEKKADSKPLKKEHSEEMDDLDRILELLAEGEISPESVDELLQM